MKVFDYKCGSCDQITELWTFDEHKCRLCGSTDLTKVYTNYRFLERRRPYDMIGKKGSSASRISVPVVSDIKPRKDRGESK